MIQKMKYWWKETRNDKWKRLRWKMGYQWVERERCRELKYWRRCLENGWMPEGFGIGDE